MARILQLSWVRILACHISPVAHGFISRISSLGQISASLAAMNRTVDDYDSMAKREIIKAKQEKAQMLEFLHSIVVFGTDRSAVQARAEVQDRLHGASKSI